MRNRLFSWSFRKGQKLTNVGTGNKGVYDLRHVSGRLEDPQMLNNGQSQSACIPDYRISRSPCPPEHPTHTLGLYEKGMNLWFLKPRNSWELFIVAV